MLEKESLRTDLMKSENEANQALASLKHREEVYNSEVQLKNKRIDELSVLLESLSSSANAKERDGVAMRIELENLKTDVEQLQG